MPTQTERVASQKILSRFGRAWTRRQTLKGLAGGLLGAGMPQCMPSLFAADVKWLKEVQCPEKEVPRDPVRGSCLRLHSRESVDKGRLTVSRNEPAMRDQVGGLEPLLEGEGEEPIRSLAEWKKKRRRLREAWMTFLGPMPQSRPAIRLKIVSEDRPKGCIRQLVRYAGEPGLPVEGYLLRPQKSPSNGKRAGVVALHQTTKNSIDEIAGLKGPQAMHIGLHLCRRGFVVFCPRCFLWQNATGYHEAVESFRRRHPQALGMHKMLYDAMRGVDVLLSLPDVDASRIGAAGHSLGAKETLYLAAFDERIKAAVASEGGIGFDFTNWDAPWYLGKGIHAPDFKLNHHQLLALIAPRAFLILAGEKGPGAADGDRTWPFIKAAAAVYELYGKPVRLGMYNHRQGHAIPPPAFQRLAEWLETYLAVST